VGSWLALYELWRGQDAAAAKALTWLDWTCVVVVAGCLQTIAVRLKRIFASLAAKQASTEDPRHKSE
jgi:hypothetical protein